MRPAGRRREILIPQNTANEIGREVPGTLASGYARGFARVAVECASSDRYRFGMLRLGSTCVSAICIRFYFGQYSLFGNLDSTACSGSGGDPLVERVTRRNKVAPKKGDAPFRGHGAVCPLQFAPPFSEAAAAVPVPRDCRDGREGTLEGYDFVSRRDICDADLQGAGPVAPLVGVGEWSWPTQRLGCESCGEKQVRKTCGRTVLPVRQFRSN